MATQDDATQPGSAWSFINIMTLTSMLADYGAICRMQSLDHAIGDLISECRIDMFGQQKTSGEAV
jgi:hypothetical protein